MPDPPRPRNASTERVIARLLPLLDARELAALRRVDALSPQERAVFVLLGHGLRAKAIAYELAISAKTVETHLVRIRVKLDSSETGGLELPDLVFLARLWARAVRDGAGVSETS